ncbi:MAG: hypothetical protein H6735_23290 [Alphaproteobacteria bacterium]|nr:hypothetical protein [Alphaproteobacteria bacterium]
MGGSTIAWLALALVACSGSTRPVGDDDDDDDITWHSGTTTETGTAETHPTTTATYGVSDLAAARLADAPSVIRVSWSQELPASVVAVFSFDGETRRSPIRSLAAGAHEELLLGIPYDTDVVWWLELDGPDGLVTTPELEARTGALPTKLPPLTVETSVPGRWDPAVDYVLLTVNESGGYFLDGYWWVQLVDRKGRVVWAHRSEFRKVTLYPRVSAAGDSILVDLDSYWGAFDGGANSQIAELRLDGVEVQRWDAPGLHHSFTQLPDRTLVYGSYTGGLGAYRENIVSIDPDTSARHSILNCDQWLASIGESRPCGTNTVSYDARTNHLLASWFTFDAITEIDLATDQVVRYFGNVSGSYAFDPPSSQFWYQHGPYFTEAGTLLLSTHADPSHQSELVVREYEVDDQNRTLHQVGVVGAGEGVSGDQMGEAHRLPSGNTLHNFGTNAHLREYAVDGEVVWELDWDREQTIGRSEPMLVDLYDLVPERP